MSKWAKIVALFFLVVSSLLFPAKFKDVPINHWAYDAVMYVSNLGIISGYPDGTFRGMDYVSRYQLAVAIYRTIEYIRKNVSAASEESSTGSEVSPAEIMKLRQDFEERFKKLENTFEQYRVYIEGKVDNVTQKLIQLSVDLANSAAKYTELKGGLTNLELRMLTQDATIENLYKLVLSEKERIDNVELNVEKLEKYVSSVDNKLSDLEDNVTKNNYEISSKIKKLEKRLENLEGLPENVNGLSTVVATNTKMLSDLRSKVIRNIENISKIEKEVSIVSSKVNRLDANFSNSLVSLEERLSKVEKDLEVLERNIQKLSQASENFVNEKEFVALKRKLDEQQFQLDVQKWLIVLSLLGLIGLGIYVLFIGGGS